MERQREEAFVAAVRENRHKLFRIALGILRSPADAEDAVSAATEQAWKYLPRVRNTDSLRLAFCTSPYALDGAEVLTLSYSQSQINHGTGKATRFRVALL